MPSFTTDETSSTSYDTETSSIYSTSTQDDDTTTRTDDTTRTDVTTTDETGSTTTDTTNITSDFETNTPEPVDPNVTNYDVRNFISPQDILKTPGRRIRTEDKDWAKQLIPDLKDIIVGQADKIKGPELHGLLATATQDQKTRIVEEMPLNIPFSFTLPLLRKDSPYWKKQCLDRWPTSEHEICAYHESDWKTMFAEKMVRESIESYKPGTSDTRELKENLNTFYRCVKKLKIKTLQQGNKMRLDDDLFRADLDDLLDDYLHHSGEDQVFLDFDLVLGILYNLGQFDWVLEHGSIDHDLMRLSIRDFNKYKSGLKKLTNLKKFRCSGGSIDTNQTTILCRLFLGHRCLSVLDLTFNYVNDDVCDYVGKLVMSECPLKELVLKGNRISSSGAETIAAVLSTNNRLQKLDLSKNWIDDSGGEFLGQVIQNHPSLVELNISENRLGGRSGKAFAEVVRVNRVLRCLSVAANKLGQESGSLLKEAVFCNDRILHLDIRFCGFEISDEDEIHLELRRHRNEEMNTENRTHFRNTVFMI